MALFGKDKKKEAVGIVAAMPPPGDMEDEDMSSPGMKPDGDDADAEGQSAAEASAFGDVRQAFANKDDAAGADALKEFLELCGYKK